MNPGSKTKKSLAMTVPERSRNFLLGFIVLFVGGCAATDAELWPPKPGEATIEFYVSLDTWHAMIGFTREEIQADNPFNESEQPKSEGLQESVFEEWG